MGADIYLNSVFEPRQELARPRFLSAVGRRDAALAAATETLGEEQMKPIRLASLIVMGFAEPQEVAMTTAQREWADKISEAQAEVDNAYDEMNSEGYFRDSYNGSSLFSLLGLSWWKLIDEMGTDIGGEKLKVLRQRIIDAWNHTKPLNGPPSGCKGTAEEWQEYFETKHKRLLALIDLAIEKDESLYCSV